MGPGVLQSDLSESQENIFVVFCSRNIFQFLTITQYTVNSLAISVSVTLTFITLHGLVGQMRVVWVINFSYNVGYDLSVRSR